MIFEDCSDPRLEDGRLNDLSKAACQREAAMTDHSWAAPRIATIQDMR